MKRKHHLTSTLFRYSVCYGGLKYAAGYLPYVYVAKIFDTTQSVATRFGITAPQLLAANPQWKNRIVIFLTPGEEVIMPDSVENSPLFFLVKSELIVKQRKTTDQNQPTTYAADWFPPEPDFGSPSSNLPVFLSKIGNPKYKTGERKDGKPRHRPIIFTDGWDGKNISKVSVPQIKDLPISIDSGSVKCDGTMRFYTKAHKAVQELFKAWEDEGLTSKILTFNGLFVPRTIGSGSNPSNHSFGTAFDINGEWNGEKKQPAAIGKTGCLLELVPLASKHGFYWGGFYTGNIDGMHFEYAKL